MLRSVVAIPCRHFETIGPNFKDQEIQKEMSEMNQHCALRYVPEERRSPVLRGGSLKSHVLLRGF